MKGRLKDRPLDLIVQEIQSRMPSGVLTLERGPAKKQICFLKGTIRFAASNMQEDRFGEFLIRAGILPEPTVRGAEEQLAPGQRLVEYLLVSGLLSPDGLRDAMRSHILGIIVPCFEWRSGDFRYEEGVPNIVGEFATDIPVIELALERARRQVSEKDVTKLLNDGNAALLPPSLPERDLQKLKLTKAETLIMARAEEGERLSEVLAVAPALRAEIARAAAALLACGIVGTAGAASGKDGGIYDTIPPALKARGKKVSEESQSSAGVRYYKQMHDLLMGADHYKTLGLETSATTEDVRRSYYTLAKEIHPDRFLSPPLDVLHQEMEELFAQVLEAYNTPGQPRQPRRATTPRGPRRAWGRSSRPATSRRSPG